MVAATGELSAAKRSYPTSEVRGRSREDPMPKGRRLRGVTPLPRSGAVAKSSRLQRRRNGGEELPKSEVRGGHERSYPTSEVGGGVGVRPRGAIQRPRSGVATRGVTPRLRSGVAAERSYPVAEVRGGGWEDQPPARGQGRRPSTPRPRSGGCTGAGEPRGAIPR